jgi:hypothetical protein
MAKYRSRRKGGNKMGSGFVWTEYWCHTLGRSVVLGVLFAQACILLAEDEKHLEQDSTNAHTENNASVSTVPWGMLDFTGKRDIQRVKITLYEFTDEGRRGRSVTLEGKRLNQLKPILRAGLYAPLRFATDDTKVPPHHSGNYAFGKMQVYTNHDSFVIAVYYYYFTLAADADADVPPNLSNSFMSYILAMEIDRLYRKYLQEGLPKVALKALSGETEIADAKATYARLRHEADKEELKRDEEKHAEEQGQPAIRN